MIGCLNSHHLATRRPTASLSGHPATCSTVSPFCQLRRLHAPRSCRATAKRRRATLLPRHSKAAAGCTASPFCQGVKSSTLSLFQSIVEKEKIRPRLRRSVSPALRHPGTPSQRTAQSQDQSPKRKFKEAHKKFMYMNLISTLYARRSTPPSPIGWERAGVRAFFLGVVLLAFGATATTVFAQSVTTDQSDYPPGSTVYITGAGFAPGETVQCQVLHIPDSGDNNTSTAHQPWTTTADDSGNISTTWDVPFDEDELGATLQLTATGQTSGLVAQATFTDASSGALTTVSAANLAPASAAQ